MNTSKESFRPSFLILWKWVCSNVTASYGNVSVKSGIHRHLRV